MHVRFMSSCCRMGVLLLDLAVRAGTAAARGAGCLGVAHAAWLSAAQGVLPAARWQSIASTTRAAIHATNQVYGFDS